MRQRLHVQTFTDFNPKKKKKASKFEIDSDDALNLIHAKMKHLNFLKQEVRYMKLLNSFLINCYNKKLTVFKKF